MYLAPHNGMIWDIYAIEPGMNEVIIKAIISHTPFSSPSQISHKAKYKWRLCISLEWEAWGSENNPLISLFNTHDYKG